jgi:hypothetical protein
MCQCRFAKAQIIGMVKEQEAGMPTAEVCLRHGLGPASSDKFKAKYGLITDLIDWIKGITFQLDWHEKNNTRNSGTR